MATVELNTWERTMLAQAIGYLRGDVALIRRAVKLLDVLDLKPDEAEAVNMHLDGEGALRWDKPQHTWPLSLSAADLTMLRQAADAFPMWSAAQSAHLFALLDKLTPPKEG